MIYVRLRGRAGNQLFIYAMARNLNLTTGQPVTICTRVDDSRDQKFHSFINDLREFNISDEIKFDSEMKFPWYANNDCLLIKVLRKINPVILFDFLSHFNVFLWLEETYKELNIKNNRNVYVDGFWQSERYFLDNRDVIIKQDLVMKKSIKDRNRFLLNEIENSESVCVTIRRGDYCSDEYVKREYYLCDEEYFRIALNKILELKPNAHLFIFSDDIEWAKKEIPVPKGTMYENGNDSISEKLYLMSHCKNFIVSNSSFSWWAQELCTYSDKIVIAPKYWYKDQRKCDIYQENWIRI